MSQTAALQNQRIATAMTPQAETWHAVTVAPGWERRVADALYEAGFAPYLPQMTETVFRKGRPRTRTRPVIPSYVFVRLAAWTNQWGLINRHDMEGVGAVVKNGDRPSPIPECQMDSVRSHSDDEERILAWLVKAGKLIRKSNKALRRENAHNRHLARLKST